MADAGRRPHLIVVDQDVLPQVLEVLDEAGVWHAPFASEPPPADPFQGLADALDFIERHRRYFDTEVDGLVDVYSEWRCSSTPGEPRVVTFSLSIVCPGHYGFEQDDESLDELWRRAAAWYGSARSTYKGGCDGACRTSPSGSEGTS